MTQEGKPRQVQMASCPSPTGPRAQVPRTSCWSQSCEDGQPGTTIRSTHIPHLQSSLTSSPRFLPPPYKCQCLIWKERTEGWIGQRTVCPKVTQLWQP